MKPLSILLFFLIVAIPLAFIHDTKQTFHDGNESMYKLYSDAFQSAVDDTSYYLSQLEAQQNKSNIHYAGAKKLGFGEEALGVFYHNLAMKFGVGGNSVERQNLMMHIPAMVFLHYDGYVLVTLEDPSGKELRPVIWPIRPYTYKLSNGNTVYFTLDEHAVVYNKPANQFVKGKHNELAAQLGAGFGQLSDELVFKQIRQNAIASNLEKDLAGAVNRHMELVRRMGLNIKFSLPRGLNEQSFQNVGMIAFMQGYPLPGGERLDAFSYGGGAVVQRKQLIGVFDSVSQQFKAYPNTCAPIGLNTVEVFYDPEEAASKGYFIQDCP
ncbi:hypothetical protein PAECIP111893_02761 [Paenibacillus plantiphilus]|uniref:Uncharacterized protein n=1 Tax=Paenibacillus plantiphilus TaxID=2905650 RepID=A0ABN8GHR7_9BACL|nr:hypothetical protein [Paenibacillus plantiphilus]CAH1207708.1 hypothetical protein PAECIP111893_02761 [Paenibacillus plantiphilus]